MRYANPEYIYAFVLVPLLVLGFILLMRWKKKAIGRLGDSSIVGQLIPEVSKGKQVARFILFTAGICFLLVAIIDPEVGSKEEEAKQEGMDLVICLDVSNSMNAEDISPSRLTRSVMAISKLIDRLHGDRIGIVVFAGDAFTQLPITSDYGAAKIMLDHIDNDIVPVQGTTIAPAIDLAVKSLSKNELTGKAIIIITDGEDHEEDAVASAKNAAAKGITVHTIGMGSPQGAPIPEYKGAVRMGFKKDMDGNTVVTQLNEKMLTDISAAGNGIYVRANNSEAGLNTIMNELEKIQRTQLGSKHFTEFEDRFQPFLLVAIILLVAEMLLTERKLAWWSRLDLFGEKKK